MSRHVLPIRTRSPSAPSAAPSDVSSAAPSAAPKTASSSDPWTPWAALWAVPSAAPCATLSTIPSTASSAPSWTVSSVYSSPPGIEHEGFPADFDGYIDILRRRVEASDKVEMHRQQLDRLLALKETFPRIEEGELEGLTQAVYKRIHSLKSFLSLPYLPADSPCRINAEAVLAKYRSGELQVEPGMVTCWAYGKQLYGPKPRDIEDMFEVAKANGGDRQCLWVEDATTLFHL
ncbi:hypothetical protein M432DRAFT_601874 [Thermoascus aurantiacus ATCC 26904]